MEKELKNLEEAGRLASMEAAKEKYKDVEVNTIWFQLGIIIGKLQDKYLNKDKQ